MTHEIKSTASLVIRPLSAEEIAELNAACPGLGDRTAEERQTVQCTDEQGHTACTYMEHALIEKLGYDYIASHCSLRYSSVFDTWCCDLSQDDFHNDPRRNPPKTVNVRFIEDKAGEHTEVYQNIESGQHYLRLLCNEPFAKWMTCGNRRTGWVDHCMVRPNITFVHGTQEETVRYKDWNGPAAYSNTFNPNFRNG